MTSKVIATSICIIMMVVGIASGATVEVRSQAHGIAVGSGSIIITQSDGTVITGQCFPDGSSPVFVVIPGETVIEIVGNSFHHEKFVVFVNSVSHIVVSVQGQAAATPSEPSSSVPTPTPTSPQTPPTPTPEPTPVITTVPTPTSEPTHVHEDNRDGAKHPKPVKVKNK